MYQFTWLASALEDLADIYVAATGEERDRMAAGVEALHRQLAADPFSPGESRDGARRLVFLPLLQVSYLIDKTTLEVVVTAVSRYGR